ncbi:MAG: Gfo/Idh/MocA family oxidoreductase [Pirellulales bacterium]|nr:Gfo/Idh/MocA family oxidoreductase [Pirellulales bacterium]
MILTAGLVCSPIHGAEGGEPLQRPLRVGIIGLDTSHVIAFTQVLNGERPPAAVRDCRVTVATPHGSRDIESSVSRIPAYTAQVKEAGVEIVGSVEEVIAASDAILLETNDGRRHLEQALPCLKAGKPTFIDKPLAASLADAVAIVDAAAHYQTPLFSASSLRFGVETLAARAGSAGEVLGCDAFSPCDLEPTHPDLFWYGVHGVETLFTVMGRGCQSVTRVHAPDVDVVLGTWEGGRIGTFRGLRSGARDYGGTVFGAKAIKPIGQKPGYEPLLAEIVKFFRTGVSPIDPAETLEIFAFMEAAELSRTRGGAAVSLSEVMAAARTEADAKRTW